LKEDLIRKGYKFLERKKIYDETFDEDNKE
jgi:hypothetical protein